MSGTPFTPPRFIPVNSSGRPYPGARLFFYRAGTTTLATVYTDSALSVPSSNPLTANAAGQFSAVYLDPDVGYYKAVLQNSSGTQLWSEDNIPSSSALSADAVGEALYPMTDEEIDAGATPVDYQYPPGNVKRYGAVGDGSTDDTQAVHAAFDVATALNGTAHFPAGRYRVTSGYTNSTSNSLTITGEGADLISATSAAASGSSVILDSTNTESFFYKQAAGNQLTVSDINFACAQYVLDRKFFVQAAVSNKHVFRNVHFVRVEQPFVFESGCYFQHSTYETIRFSSSGTWHSKTTSLVGTLMNIINCDVEDFVPANTEKVICNLSGIRQVHSMNFVIEPATPATGWTALKFHSVHDGDWVRMVNGTFIGLWIECTGSGLTYTIDQTRGRTMLIDYISNNATSPYRLAEHATVDIVNSTFSGNANALETLFTLTDYTCQVRLTNCNYRNPGAAINDPRFTFDNCSMSPSDGAEIQTATAHNNTQSQLLWAFDGGYPDAGKVTVNLSGGTTIVPTVHATYGRALNIVPSGGAVAAKFQGNLRDDFPQGGQLFVVARGVLPTISSGTLEMNFLLDGSSLGGSKAWTSADSGAAFTVILPITANVANPTNMGVQFSGAAGSNLVLYQLELWIGKSMPNVTMPSFPTNVITFNSAAPTAGQWARGDVVWNTAPSAGGTPGWVCTTGGTPGTWRAMANLA